MSDYNLWIEVDLRALKRNVSRIRSHVAPSVGTMAIVKANAYGHGMIEVAHALCDMVSYFGVSTFQEGERLREAGIMIPTLVLGSIMPYEFEAAIHHDLTLAVSDAEYAAALHEADRKSVV